jgi:hypothetical protein
VKGYPGDPALRIVPSQQPSHAPTQNASSEKEINDLLPAAAMLKLACHDCGEETH